MIRKAIFILLFLPLLFSMTAGQNNDTLPGDNIPEKVKVEAMIKTDQQIDSVYEKVPRWADALYNQFDALRSYQDTLNAKAIIREQQYEQAAIERDRAVNTTLKVIAENTKLRASSKEKDKKIDFSKTASHYFMIFIVALAASFFGTGFNNYLNKKKKDA